MTTSLRTFMLGAAALGILSAAGCTRDPHALRIQHEQQARKYVEAGKFAEAVIEYRTALETDPLSGENHLRLGECYEKLGDAANAAGALIRAADLLPTRVDVQLKAGTLLLVARRFDDAKVRAERALAADPRNVDALVLLANSLANLRSIEAAIAQVEEAIRLDPSRSSTYGALGAIEVARGRSEEAERAFKRAIELDDASPAPHLAIANFYWVSGRMPEAETELRRALSLDSSSVIARRAISGFFIAINRLPDAEAHLQAVYDLTRSPASGLALADFYVANRNAQAARDVLQALAQQQNVHHAEIALRLASLDLDAGHRDEAYRQIDAVLAGNPDDLQGLLVKTAALLSDRRLDEALAAAMRAVQTHPDAAAAFNALGRVQAARQQTDAAMRAYEMVLRLNPRATSAQVAIAQLDLAAGRTKRSTEMAATALRSDPSNAEAQLTFVRSLIGTGNLERAMPELDRLRAQYPQSVAVLVMTGLAQAQKHDPAARVTFEQALRLDPGSTEALSGLVALDFVAKRPADATARVHGLIDKADTSVPRLMVAGRTYVTAGDLPTAERYFRRILERDPAYLQAYVALGQIYVIQHRLDDALAEFERLAKSDPRPVAPLTFAGVILQAQGKAAQAQEHFERVLQIDPAAAVAANNLAWLYSESGKNLDVALQLARTARRKLPDNPDVADTLGVIYYKKNMLPQAIDALKAAVDKEPGRPVFQYHLGLALHKNGDTADASQHLKRALNLRSDFDGAADAKAVLQTLPSK